MKKCVSFFSFAFIFCLSVFPFTQERYILENSLEVFTIKDSANPNCKIYYVNEAGFSAQEKNNTGIAQLYANIFWKTNPNLEKAKRDFLLSDFTNECLQNQTVYSFCVSSSFLDNALMTLSNQLKSPIYPESEISAEFSKMSKSVNKSINEAELYINAAIDSRVFSEYPWKHDTGINALTFVGQKIEKVRTQLTNFGRTFYTPQKSALIIVSPYEDETVLQMVKNHFEDWKNPYVKISKENANTIEEKRNFVLVTDAISDELNQIVVQYRDKKFFSNQENITATQLAAISLEKNNSKAKKTLCENAKLGILGAEYINFGFNPQGENSRLIIQSLFQADLENPTTQAKIFLDAVNKNASFDFEDYFYAKQNLKLQTELAQDSSFQFAKLIAYRWIFEHGNEKLTILSSENTSENDMNKVFEITPYVFLLVSPNNYEKYKKSFDKNGFSVITKENAFWFRQNNSRKNDSGKKIANIDSEKSVEQKIIENYKNNAQSFTLSNGIKVFTQLNSQNSTASILLHFDGGEIQYKKNQRGMEKILLETLARNIKIQIRDFYEKELIKDTGNVKVETSIYSGSICVSCITEDFEKILYCINNALAYGTIYPSLEDELIFYEKSNWKYKSCILNFQLKCKALRSFFTGKDEEFLFSCTSDILENISFNEVRALYVNLFNAQRLSVVVTGNVGGLGENALGGVSATLGENASGGVGAAWPLKTLLENTFSVLPKLEFAQKEKSPIQFKEVTQISHLKRIFGSDIKAKDAGPRPEHLIPTTEFKDPALVFIKCPEKNSTDYAAFLLTLNLIVQNAKDDLANSQNPTLFSDASIFEISEVSGIIGVEFEKVENSKELFKYFQKEISSCPKKISKKSVEKAKVVFQSELFENLTTSEFLAEKINENKKASLSENFHIELYEKIFSLNSVDISKAWEKYFSKVQFYWLFSAETKY